MITVLFALVFSIGTGVVFATEAGRRSHYADQNGDGICDNRTDGRGQGNQHGNGHRKHCK